MPVFGRIALQMVPGDFPLPTMPKLLPPSANECTWRGTRPVRQRRLSMQYRALTDIAECIGCNCNDLRACQGGCAWLRVDYKAHLGVCSRCKYLVSAWDTGDRSKRTSAQHEATSV